MIVECLLKIDLPAVLKFIDFPSLKEKQNFSLTQNRIRQPLYFNFIQAQVYI